MDIMFWHYALYLLLSWPWWLVAYQDGYTILWVY